MGTVSFPWYWFFNNDTLFDNRTMFLLMIDHKQSIKSSLWLFLIEVKKPLFRLMATCLDTELLYFVCPAILRVSVSSRSQSGSNNQMDCVTKLESYMATETVLLQLLVSFKSVFIVWNEKVYFLWMQAGERRERDHRFFKTLLTFKHFCC